jgi:hypothetical protein
MSADRNFAHSQALVLSPSTAVESVVAISVEQYRDGDGRFRNYIEAMSNLTQSQIVEDSAAQSMASNLLRVQANDSRVEMSIFCGQIASAMEAHEAKKPTIHFRQIQSVSPDGLDNRIDLEECAAAFEATEYSTYRVDGRDQIDVDDRRNLGADVANRQFDSSRG